MTCTRRDALHTIGLAAAATTVPACTSAGNDDTNVPAGVAEMCGADLCFKISENPELGVDGGIVVLTQAPSKKILVVRVSATDFLAFSAFCTHAGCSVAFNGKTKFNCPCHGSSFDMTGAVLNGPAQRPLDDFATTVAGDDVTISIA